MTQPEPGIPGKQIWQRLMAGNMRFVQGLFMGRNLIDLRRSLAGGQKPAAAVLCCADSRVPPELIFDQSLGDFFVVRTAGLVLEPTSIGSLEYAVAHLEVPLLLIKGHEACGAVTAAVEHPDHAESHIAAVVRQLAPAAAQARQQGLKGSPLVEAATDLYLLSLKETLRQESPIIREALDQGRLSLLVTKYSLHSGQINTLSSPF